MAATLAVSADAAAAATAAAFAVAIVTSSATFAFAFASAFTAAFALASAPANTVWTREYKGGQLLLRRRWTFSCSCACATRDTATKRFWPSTSVGSARVACSSSTLSTVRTRRSCEWFKMSLASWMLSVPLTAAQEQEQENVRRLQSRSWPPLHSRVQTVFAEAEARAKAAVKAEAKAKAKVAEEVAMATAKAAAEAEADADAETAKAAAKEAAEEANQERLERYKAHEQVPPICAPLACLTRILTSSPHNLTLPHSMRRPRRRWRRRRRWSAR